MDPNAWWLSSVLEVYLSGWKIGMKKKKKVNLNAGGCVRWQATFPMAVAAGWEGGFAVTSTYWWIPSVWCNPTYWIPYTLLLELDIFRFVLSTCADYSILENGVVLQPTVWEFFVAFRPQLKCFNFNHGCRFFCLTSGCLIIVLLRFQKKKGNSKY